MESARWAALKKGNPNGKKFILNLLEQCNLS